MKEHHIIIRVSKDEKAKIQKSASASGMKMSRYIRHRLDDETVLRAYDATEFDVFKRLYFELGKIGTNINQIAYNVNARFAPSFLPKGDDYSVITAQERQAFSCEVESLREALFHLRQEIAQLTRKAS